jgi:hypothetical protein
MNFIKLNIPLIFVVQPFIVSETLKLKWNSLKINAMTIQTSLPIEMLLLMFSKICWCFITRNSKPRRVFNYWNMLDCDRINEFSDVHHRCRRFISLPHDDFLSTCKQMTSLFSFLPNFWHFNSLFILINNWSFRFSF